MAVILGVYDGDNERRTDVRQHLPKSLSGLTHLHRQEVSFHDMDIFWEASVSTPVSIATDQLGPCKRMAWVVGDFDTPYAINSDAAQRLLVRTAVDAPDMNAISGQNGYYLAVLFDDTPHIVLGTDVLGFFPFYYWSQGDVFLFGTSPELFKLHPLFVAKPNIHAIASILLISHISGGQAIYQGVYRNKPGHFVDWTPQSDARETQANSICMSDQGFSLSYSETRDRVNGCFEDFFKPLTILSHVDIFLSGGQDSRMVAGYAAKRFPSNNVQAVSLGHRADTELQYALKVSNVLGWRHRYCDIPHQKYEEFAVNQLRLESLQGPFVNFVYGTAQLLLAESNSPFLSGYVGDPVLGDGQILRAFSKQKGLFEFEEIFTYSNRYGFQKNGLIDIFSDYTDRNSIIDTVIQNLQQDFDNIEALPFQKAWLYWMTHRSRFHVGSIIWRLSLGAWPLLPYLDRRLLETVAAMPFNYFSERRIQADIIKKNFPHLAQLPLDRNSRKPGYLIKPFHQKLLDSLPSASSISWRLHQWLERRQTRRENRYYFRTYDFNAPGWQSVRQEADLYRNQIGNLLNPQAIERLLPLAGTHPYFNDGIIDSAKIKTLVGLVLWNRMNFISTK